MDSNYLPLWKTLDAPLFSLDESHVELFSILCLFLLAFVAMLARKHRQAVRHVVQAVALVVFFYIVYSCLGVFGMIRNSLHGMTLIGSVFTEAFFWMSLPVTVVAFSLTSGPYFCGWICPTGTFQEWTCIVREKIVGRIRLPGSRGVQLILLLVVFAGFLAWIFHLGTTKHYYVEDSSLHWGAALLLLVFLVLARVADDAAVRNLRAVSLAIIVGSALLKTAIISPMHFAFADVRDPASALTTLILVVASLFIGRAWCRYVCPWGYLMGCTHRVSRLRVETVGTCTACGSCRQACRVDAIRDGQVSLSDCQFCLACVDRCPNGALEVVDAWKRKA